MGLAPLLIVGSHALAIVTVLINYIKLQLKMKVAYNIFNKTKPLPFMIEKKISTRMWENDFAGCVNAATIIQNRP